MGHCYWHYMNPHIPKVWLIETDISPRCPSASNVMIASCFMRYYIIVELNIHCGQDFENDLFHVHESKTGQPGSASKTQPKKSKITPAKILTQCKNR